MVSPLRSLNRPQQVAQKATRLAAPTGGNGGGIPVKTTGMGVKMPEKLTGQFKNSREDLGRLKRGMTMM